MDKEQKVREALANKIKKSKAAHFYILKGGYYYRPNYRGYTVERIEAGVYTKKQAADHVLNTCGVCGLPVDRNDHNKAILDEIKRLTGFIID